MKRIVVVAVAVLTVAGVPGAAPAGAVQQPGVLWVGKTEDGGRVFLRTVRRDGVRQVQSFQADLSVTCELTHEVLAFTFGAFTEAPTVDGAFSYDEVVFNTAFHIAGDLGTDDGAGTVSLGLAGFTPNEQTQRCDSGLVHWKVHRRAPSSAVAPVPATRIDVRDRRVTVSRDGTTRVSSGEPIRPWFGETEQGFEVFFETIGRPGARRIGTYDIGAFAPCPSGGFAVGLQILGYADLPLDHGTWRIDEVSLFAATHWAGAIADSEGHGTLEMSLPAFTPNEELQVCTSGEVSWRAHPGPIVGHTARAASPGLTLTSG